MHAVKIFRALALLSALALSALPGRASTLENFDLDAYKGKVVLVDFWASWCAPCKESFPWMQRLENAYADQGLVVIAVNVDHERHLADRFLLQLQPSFPIVYDPKGQLAEHFGVEHMPSSFYVDRRGKIRYTHNGFHSNERDQAEHELATLVAEQ